MDVSYLITEISVIFGKGVRCTANPSGKGQAVTLKFMKIYGDAINMSRNGGSEWLLHISWMHAVRIIAILDALLLLPWTYAAFEDKMQCGSEVFSPFIEKGKSQLKQMFKSTKQHETIEMNSATNVNLSQKVSDMAAMMR